MKDIINKNDGGAFLSRKPIIFLKKKIWKIELKPDDVKRFLKHNKRTFIFSLIAAVFIFGAVVYMAVVKAEIANFYPTSCLGGWQNPQNAQNKPELNENALPEEFSETNSAVLKNVISQIFCGNFEGEMPEEDSQLQKVSLKFSWLIKTESELSTNNDFSEATSALIETILPEEATSTPAIQEETVPAEEATSSPSASFWNPIRNFISNGASKIIHFAFAEETSTQENSTPPIIMENIDTASSSPEYSPIPEIPEATGTNALTPDTSTPPIEEIVESASIIESLTPSLPIATTTDAAGAEEAASVITPITPPAPEPFLEAFYTLDGANWQSLGKINLDNWQDLKFEIPNFSWENISKLQINIQSLSPIDFAPIVYLDGLRLEAEYEPKKSMDTLIENLMPDGAETASRDEKGMKINDISPLDKRLFSVPANSRIFPGECLETSYILKDENKNIYIYKESDMSSAYRDFGPVGRLAVISIGFGENGENICPLSLYEQGVFHFLEVDDPERIVCADNIGYEECKSKSTGKETILEIK